MTTGTFPAVQAWALGMPLDKQAAFMADLFAHVCSYAVGALAAAWKRYA